MVTSEDRTHEFMQLLSQQQQQQPHRPIVGGGSSSSGTNSATTLGSSRTNPTKGVGGTAIATTSSTTATTATSELRTFHEQASDISRDITSTSTLLKELTYKIQHKSMLFDNDNESKVMNQLVVQIKQSIENLNGRLEQLSQQMIQLKRNKKLTSNNTNNSQIHQMTNNVLTGLQTEFVETASMFKQVLQQRTDTMKETEDMLQKQVYNAADGNEMEDIPDMSVPNHHHHHHHRISMMEPPPIYSTNNNTQQPAVFPTLDLTTPFMMSTGEPTSSSSSTGLPSTTTGSNNPFYNPTLLNQQQSSYSTYSGQYSQYGGGSSSGGGSGGNVTSMLTPYDIQRMEQEQSLDQQQMLQLIPDNNKTQAYIQSRADAMSTVESNIVELGTIFQKLAGLVHEHSEMVQRVEDNVNDTHDNMNLSMNVLTDTLQNLRSNKALAMRLFGVLVAFIIMFIIFFA